jgi:HEAT repeat protein
MNRRIVGRVSIVVCLLAALAVLIPGSPVYLPELLASSADYEGRSARVWARDLNHPDFQTRSDAIFALGAIGERAGDSAPALAEIMVNDPEPDFRAKAALAISKMGPASRPVIPALAQALKDREPLVRMNAARALFRLGADAKPAVPALIEAVRDERNEARADLFRDTVQELVALTLGRATTGTDDAVPALVESLKAAKTNSARIAICRALGDIGPAAGAALPAIRQQIENQDVELHAAAEKARLKIEGDRPAAARPAETPKVAELPETERQYLWEIEHRGNVLVKYGFARVAAALREADREGLNKLLAQDFAGADLGEPRKIRSVTAFAEVERAEDAGRPAVTLGRESFLTRLLDFRRPFAAAPHVKLALMTLHPQRRGDLSGMWEGRAQLRIAGEHSVTAPAEAVVTLQFETPEPTEETLARTGWLRGAGIVQTITAQAPRYLFAEVGRDRGLNVDRLHDNWTAAVVEPNTGGVYVCDFDRDGYLDMLVTDINGCVLYRGGPGGRFEDVTKAFGLPDPKRPTLHTVAAWIDIDGDGWEDLILGTKIFRNDRGVRFTDVTVQSDLRLPLDALGIVVADYDRDGKLDLYVTRGARSQSGAWAEGTSSNTPGNLLFRNLGNWQFQNVTRASGTGGGGRSSFTAAWLDANNDGWPDLYVGNEFGDGLLLVNKGDGTFAGRPMADHPSDFGTMGLAVGDINNDGLIDVYSANMYSKAGTRVIGNLLPDAYPPALMEKMRRFVAGSQLHLNKGNLAFDQVGAKMQVAAVGWAYGACLADLDGDGFLDLYATAGYVSRDRSKPDG